MRRLILGAVALTVSGAFGVVVLLLLAAAGGSTLPAADTACSSTVAPAAGTTTELKDAQQRTNAATIITTGQRLHVPAKGLIVAIATAMQESTLHNINYGTGSSVGLFQQIAAWGPTGDREDPRTAATMFFTGGRHGQRGLLDIPGWQTMSVNDAAQAVQGSAFPNAYGKWEPLATTVVHDIAPTATEDPAVAATDCAPDDTSDDTTNLGTAVGLPAKYQIPAGTPAPIVAAIRWALAQQGTSYVYGGDCTDAHGSDPAHRCDCSSLTQQAYRAGGIDLPRTTVGQVDAGTAVTDTATLLPGDLVFIAGSEGTPAHPRHVGLYLGSGLLIEAPHTGDVVKIVRVRTWAPYAAVRRITS